MITAGCALGVCSWSLRPASARDLADRVRACGLSCVQLALGPIVEGAWDEQETVETLRGAGVAIASGMLAFRGEDYSTLDSIRRTGGVRPDADWKANLESARASAALAQRLGIGLVTFHAGFLPEDPRDPVRAVMIDRLKGVIDCFASRGVRTAFETGQEDAPMLLEVLGGFAGGRADAIEAPGVNFDPANMILYGMGNPVEALRRLAPRVRQIHIKDAVPSSAPGEWGAEVRTGTGAVDWPAFFDVVRSATLRCGMMIEREARTGTLDDIIAARDLVRRYTD